MSLSGLKITFAHRDRSCQNMLRYTQTPVQEIHDPLLDKAGVRLLIKREDLNHPFVSGNKWWKLIYNLQEAIQQGHSTLLTFGGAYSNHVYATAAAAHELGLNSIGIIRGEEVRPLNSTLAFATSKGMQLHYVTREDYRVKNERNFMDDLHKSFGDFYLIPEGGTNKLAVRGVSEFAQSLGDDFDYLCCGAGTGGTMAGLIQGLSKKKKLIGIQVLKGEGFLKNDINMLLTNSADNWEINTQYHFGGYAKSRPELLAFMEDFKNKFKIPLEYVYTGKVFFGVLDLIKKGYFKKGSTILVLHSGGIR